MSAALFERVARSLVARWRCLHATGEEGAVTLEVIIATPLLILFLLVVVALGQVVTTDIALDGATAAAARAASIATTPQAASAAAQASVISAGGLGCASVHVATNTSDFVAGGSVDVTLTCSMDLSTFSGLGLPVTTTLSSSSSQPLDAYRSYGG